MESEAREMPRRRMSELLFTLRTRRAQAPAHIASDSVAAFPDSTTAEVDQCDRYAGYAGYAGYNGDADDAGAAAGQDVQDTAPPGRQHLLPDTFPASLFALTTDPSAASSTQSAAQDTSLTHARACALLLKQQDSLLPPADANALAAHLLDCDACYRYAQEIAVRRHTTIP